MLNLNAFRSDRSAAPMYDRDAMIATRGAPGPHSSQCAIRLRLIAACERKLLRTKNAFPAIIRSHVRPRGPSSRENEVFLFRFWEKIQVRAKREKIFFSIGFCTESPHSSSREARSRKFFQYRVFFLMKFRIQVEIGVFKLALGKLPRILISPLGPSLNGPGCLNAL